MLPEHSSATRYFVDYWEDLFSGVSSQRDLLKSFNPRVVIQELLDEVTLNKQRNISNEVFFKRILGGYLNRDPGSGMRLKVHLQMILNELNVAKNRPRYLPVLCTTALRKFTDFVYFEDCLTALINLTTMENIGSEEKKQIKSITNHLIVEFRMIGYTDEMIRKIPQLIFSVITHINGDNHWEFPYPQQCEDWRDTAQVTEFWKVLSSYQASLTEIDRLRALLTFAKKQPDRYRFVFRVNGMVGDAELNVDDVLFYSPINKRLIAQDSNRDAFDSDAEWFRAEIGSKVINAAVTVEAISADSGSTIARSKVEKALALCRRLVVGEIPPRLWLSRSCVALNEKGQIIYGSHHAFERSDDEIWKKFKLTKKEQTQLEAQWVNTKHIRDISNANGWGRRFKEACYWLRKAEESDSNVEELLSYWICIETLCAKSDEDAGNWFETKAGARESDIALIKEVVGKIVALGKCYQRGWMVHQELSQPHILFGLSKNIIPESLASKAQLNTSEGDQIYLVNFIQCCDEIEKSLPSGLLKEQVAELVEFYHQKKIALEVLRNHLETAQDELAFIYRMRNKIAHDGNSDHFLLPSLCKLAAHYARSLFGRISNYIERGEEVELRTILITAVQEYDCIEARLQNEEPIHVFLGEQPPAD